MAFASERARPDRAFERLYRRHVDEVYRYAFAVLANAADAEDVTQTAFLNAYRAYQSGQRPERPLNWLIAIAHNICRQRFRDAARRPREVVLEHDLASSDHDEEDGFRQEDIRRALSQLSFSQRSALALRELEGRSYKEIAELLDLTEAAVETLIFRARRAFREQLEASLTCSEAERAISRQLDGMLSRTEKADLRGHLRACPECASLARRLRGQRSALRGGLALLPLPPSLASFSFGGGAGLAGGAAVGAGVGVKVAAIGLAALVAAGVSTGVVVHNAGHPARAASEAAVVRTDAAAQVVSRVVSRPNAPAVRKVHATQPGGAHLLASHRRAGAARPALPVQAATTSASTPVIHDVPAPSEHAAPAAQEHASSSGATGAAHVSGHAETASDKHSSSGGGRANGSKAKAQAAKSKQDPPAKTKPEKQKPAQTSLPEQATNHGPPDQPGPPADVPAQDAGTPPAGTTPDPSAGGPPADVTTGPPSDPGANGNGNGNGNGSGNGNGNGHSNGSPHGKP